MSKLYQLIYSSTSTDQFDVSTDIDNILTSSKGFNVENEVTGVLIYKGGVFIQLLEGDESSVRTLFDKISSDSRHEELKVLYQGDTSERIFPHWSMAYKESDLYSMDVQEKIDSFLSDLNYGEGIIAKGDILSFLQKVKYAF